MIVSDHSPCTEDLKKKEGGDYLACWGGIPSLQWGLSVAFTEGIQKRSCSYQQIVKWMCEAPAELIGLSKRKGKIAVGYDADIVIFNPTKKFQVTKDSLVHKNKLSPYEGLELTGQVETTILRGEVIYENGSFKEHRGQLILTE